MRLLCLALGLAAFLAACGDTADSSHASGGSGGAPNEAPPLPWPATEFPPLPKVAQDVPEARIKLGNFLFYDPILSVDGETACATCHSEFWGMRCPGCRRGKRGWAARGSGPRGREHPAPQLPRSVQHRLPRNVLFWDGREASLEVQAITPLLAEDELNLDPEVAVAELMAIPSTLTSLSKRSRTIQGSRWPTSPRRSLVFSGRWYRTVRSTTPTSVDIRRRSMTSSSRECSCSRRWAAVNATSRLFSNPRPLRTGTCHKTRAPTTTGEPK